MRLVFVGCGLNGLPTTLQTGWRGVPVPRVGDHIVEPAAEGGGNEWYTVTQVVYNYDENTIFIHIAS